MSQLGHLRRINGADPVSGSHLIAVYCCAARPTQAAETGHAAIPPTRLLPRASSLRFVAPIRTRSEWPSTVSADINGRGRVGAVRLLGCRLGPEGRAGLEVVFAAERVAHDMRVRRNDNPLLALRILDHDAWIAGAGERCTDRSGR